MGVTSMAWLRRTFVILLLSLALLTQATPASAHYLSHIFIDCFKSGFGEDYFAYLNHGTNYQGLQDGYTEEFQRNTDGVPCAWPASVYRLALNEILWHWVHVPGSVHEWRICTTWGWFYKKASIIRKSWDYGKNSPNTTPCDDPAVDDYYSFETEACIWNQDPDWFCDSTGLADPGGPNYYHILGWGPSGPGPGTTAVTSASTTVVVPDVQPPKVTTKPPLPGNLPDSQYPPDPARPLGV